MPLFHQAGAPPGSAKAMPMLIRQTEPEDLDGLLALFEQVADERIYIGTEPGFDREAKRRGFASRIGDDAYRSIVAIDDAVVVGSAGVHTHSEYGPTIGMLIAKSHRRHGVGRAMMADLDEWAARRGLPALHLFVFAHNGAAIAFYRETGWVEVERFERDVTRQTGEVYDTVLMRKSIA